MCTEGGLRPHGPCPTRAEGRAVDFTQILFVSSGNLCKTLHLMGSGVYREGHAPVVEALHRTQQCLLRIRCRGLLAVIVLLGFAYAPASPAPVPIPPAPYDTPSISHFPESRHPHDIPRLLLLHDFPVKNTEREAVDNSLKFARQKYKSLMKYIEGAATLVSPASPLCV